MTWDTPASEVLAERLFNTWLGHTGLSWDALGEHGRDDWLRKAGKLLEGMYDTQRPLLVIDIANDTIECRAPSSDDMVARLHEVIDHKEALLACYRTGTAPRGTLLDLLAADRAWLASL